MEWGCVNRVLFQSCFRATHALAGLSINKHFKVNVNLKIPVILFASLVTLSYCTQCNGHDAGLLPSDSGASSTYDNVPPELYTIVYRRLQRLKAQPGFRHFLSQLRLMPTSGAISSANQMLDVYLRTRPDGAVELGVDLTNRWGHRSPRVVSPPETPDADKAQIRLNPFFALATPKRNDSPPDGTEPHHMMWYIDPAGFFYSDIVASDNLGKPFGQIRLNDNHRLNTERQSVSNVSRTSKKRIRFVSDEGSPKPKKRKGDYLDIKSPEIIAAANNEISILEAPLHSVESTPVHSPEEQTRQTHQRDFRFCQGEKGSGELYIAYPVSDLNDHEVEFVVYLGALEPVFLTDIIDPDLEYPAFLELIEYPSPDDTPEERKRKERKLIHYFSDYIHKYHAMFPEESKFGLMINKLYGAGISAQVSDGVYPFQSIVIKQTFAKMKTLQDIKEVITNLAVYTLFAQKAGVVLDPVKYLWIESDGEYTLYAVQRRRERFIENVLNDPSVAINEKRKAFKRMLDLEYQFDQYNESRIKANNDSEDGLIIIQGDPRPGNYVDIHGTFYLMDIVPPYFRFSHQSNVVNEQALEMFAERENIINALTLTSTIRFLFWAEYPRRKQIDYASKLEKLRSVKATSNEYRTLYRHYTELHNYAIGLISKNKKLMAAFKSRAPGSIKGLTSENSSPVERARVFYDQVLWCLENSSGSSDGVTYLCADTELAKQLVDAMKREVDRIIKVKTGRKKAKKPVKTKQKYISKEYQSLKDVSDSELTAYLQYALQLTYQPIRRDGMCFWESILAALKALPFEHPMRRSSPEGLMDMVIAMRNQMTNEGVHQYRPQEGVPIIWGDIDDIPVVMEFFLLTDPDHPVNILLIYLTEDMQPVGIFYEFHSTSGHRTILRHPITDQAELTQIANRATTLTLFNHLRGDQYDNTDDSHWGALIPQHRHLEKVKSESNSSTALQVKNVSLSVHNMTNKVSKNFGQTTPRKSAIYVQDKTGVDRFPRILNTNFKAALRFINTDTNYLTQLLIISINGFLTQFIDSSHRRPGSFLYPFCNATKAV